MLNYLTYIKKFSYNLMKVGITTQPHPSAWILQMSKPKHKEVKQSATVSGRTEIINLAYPVPENWA